MKAIYLFILLLTASYSAWCFQQPVMEGSEKVYFSLDKPYHAAGEEMAVSVFLLDRLTHQLQESPGMVYLELFHPQGQRLLSQTIRTEKGRGLGRLLLPDTLSGGVYRIAAFTQKMALENVPALCKETFIDGGKVLRKEKREGAVELSFFPEGGKMVENLESVVGVRILNAPSARFTGEIVDNEGSIIGKYSVSENGTGSFRWTPRPDSFYYGRIKIGGQLIQAPLPQASKEGYVLEVNDTDPDSLRIGVTASPVLYGEKFSLKFLSRGRVILEASGLARYHGYRIKVPVSSLLPGIGYVQLFSEGGDLLASRPVQLEEPKKVVLSLSSTKEQYLTRAPVKFKVQVKDKAGRPLMASFAASVYDKKFAAPQAHSHNIRQELLVERELGAAVSVPELPAAQQTYDPGKAKEMDYFLLTFSADNGVQYKPKAKKGYLNVLEGRVLLKETAQPLADTSLIVGMVSKNQSAPVFLFAKTDEEGRFSITLPAVNISSSVYLKVKGVDDLQDLIDYQVEKEDEKVLLPERKLSKNWFDIQHTAGYYTTFVENTLINEAFSVSPVQVQEESSARLSGYDFRSFDAVYNMEEYQVLPGMRDIIIGILAGVRVKQRNGSYRIVIDAKDPASGKSRYKLPGEPLLLLDGVPVNNPDILFNLSPADIEKIEVAHATWYIDEFPVNGIFSVTTRNKAIHQREDVYHYSYTSVGVPASGKYSFLSQSGSEDDLSARIPDFRPLLYFQPVAETNTEGEADFLFYTSDDVSTYRIFVEGITADGRPFSGFKDFTVEKIFK